MDRSAPNAQAPFHSGKGFGRLAVHARRAHAPIFDIAFQQVVSIMKILAAALLSLSFLAASAVAGADASADVSPDTNLDEAELVATLEGGHWRSGDAKGTYRVILSVGFEHVSCRVWIEWLADARSGGASQASRRGGCRRDLQRLLVLRTEAQRPVGRHADHTRQACLFGRGPQVPGGAGRAGEYRHRGAGG